MTYREAGQDDCIALAEMNHQLIHDEGHCNPMTVPELTERMRRWLSDRRYHAVLFEDNRDAVAYALYRAEPDSSIYLRQFFVARDHRRQGFGSRAVAMLFREVFPAEARVKLDVLAHNGAATDFWGAVGFQRYSVCLERFNTPFRTG